MTMTAVAPWTAAAFEEFLANRQEPVWLTERRRQAFATYQKLLKQPLDPEEFKRLDLRALRPEKYSLITTEQAATLSTLMADRAEFGGTVSHIDGRSVVSQLRPEYAALGVVFGSWETVLATRPEILQALERAVPADSDRFSAWHAAFCTGGTVLYVPRNVELSAPLYSLIGLSAENAADLSHTLVVLEEGASATLLEETCSDSATAAGLHVGAVELLLAPGSQLRYVQLQNWNDKVWHIAHQSGRVARDASLQWTVAGLGSRFAHIHQAIHLDGRGASAEVNGVTFATERQVISYYTQQDHHAPDTRSDLLYKDVLRDRARVVWRGMIKVDKDAQKTDGYQRNDALLMSADARSDLIPGLEIEADDVRCTHGATAGRVDEEQLFYCMCRGLSRSEAMHMIVEGFFQRIYDRIPVELVRETLSQAVQKKLGLGD
ncbi:Fe-S cluster assembly protein SufD [bacterium]|nr:Fe-S cluster assembly protein SufD [bacterium]